MSHLTGPVTDRPNRATYPMTASEARGVLRGMEKDVKSAKRRRAMAASFATNAAGKLSPEAVAVYAEYAAQS